MKKYQEAVDTWFKEKDWPYWHPLEQFTRLVEETGELARILNHIHGPKKKKSEEAEQSLEDEIGDVLYTLICLANSQNVDLDRAIERSIDKVANRDKNRYQPSS